MSAAAISELASGAVFAKAEKAEANAAALRAERGETSARSGGTTERSVAAGSESVASQQVTPSVTPTPNRSPSPARPRRPSLTSGDHLGPLGWDTPDAKTSPAMRRPRLSFTAPSPGMTRQESAAAQSSSQSNSGVAHSSGGNRFMASTVTTKPASSSPRRTPKRPPKSSTKTPAAGERLSSDEAPEEAPKLANGPGVELDNLVLISEAGGITPLVTMLSSQNGQARENAAGALMHLALDPANVSALASHPRNQCLVHEQLATLQHGFCSQLMLCMPATSLVCALLMRFRSPRLPRP